MGNRIGISIALAFVAVALPVQLAGAQGPVADEGLRHTADGVQYYVDPAPQVSSPSAARASRAAVASAPLNQTFKLHSLAASPRKLYLDFNGYTVPTPGDPLGMHPGAVSGFNLEGSAGTFTANELNQIQATWKMAAEKFSPFNIDVTTADPGVAALQRTNNADGRYGMRIVITESTAPMSQSCGSCAGVAVLGSFDSLASNKTGQAWVFASQMFNNNTIIAQTIAHEAGHTFGLNHDGVTSVTEYYQGHDNWLPIMGIGFNGRALDQWSKGEYAGANNTEDDLAIISANGAPFRADDYANSPGAATTLSTDTVYRRNGVIRNEDDADVFKVNRSCVGTLAASAVGIGMGGTLDLTMRVFDGDFNQIGDANPDPSGQTTINGDASPTNVNASVSLPAQVADTYYVMLYGTGSGTPPVNGYSAYGSVGQYTVTISGCAGTKPKAAKIGTATSGKKKGVKNAVARWAAPVNNGGTPITSYKVIATKIVKGKLGKSRVSKALSASARSLVFPLPAGKYKFRVVAYNKLGAAPASGFSRAVLSR